MCSRRVSIGALLMLVAVIQIAPAAWATVVSGQITNSVGAGIANVDLDFIDRDTDNSIPLTNDDTDFLGFFAVNVPTGNYDIRFKPPQGARYVGIELRGENVQGVSMTLN